MVAKRGLKLLQPGLVPDCDLRLNLVGTTPCGELRSTDQVRKANPAIDTIERCTRSLSVRIATTERATSNAAAENSMGAFGSMPNARRRSGPERATPMFAPKKRFLVA